MSCTRKDPSLPSFDSLLSCRACQLSEDATKKTRGHDIISSNLHLICGSQTRISRHTPLQRAAGPLPRYRAREGCHWAEYKVSRFCTISCRRNAITKNQAPAASCGACQILCGMRRFSSIADNIRRWRAGARWAGRGSLNPLLEH